MAKFVRVENWHINLDNVKSFKPNGENEITFIFKDGSVEVYNVSNQQMNLLDNLSI
jgi:hypothetical protein|tara:strand:+ start:633 stop:800 length:168 start_codon:yes stop_codon:yes gene_type:complete